jgi:site-specific recombinase XerD
MSLFKREGAATYSYDFWCKGERYTGNTGATTKVEAQRFEKLERDKAGRQALIPNAGATERTLAWATNRFWAEVGKRQKGNVTTLRDLTRLRDFFGDDTPIADIGDDMVAQGVEWRRSHKVHGREESSFVSAATVNRSFTKRLQAVLRRARSVWKCPLPNEPNWKEHLLREPKERVRFVRTHEEALLDDAIRDDYKALVDFARASGLRQKECLLRKDQVDLPARLIHAIGKGDKPIEHPITSEMRRILMTAMANPTPYVFHVHGQASSRQCFAHAATAYR